MKNEEQTAKNTTWIDPARLHLAGLAMVGFIGRKRWTGNITATASDAVEIADACLAELRRTAGEKEELE